MCHSYTSGWINAWTIPDPPVPGLFEFLEAALEHFQVSIYSSRSGFERGREAMRLWFDKWAFHHFKSANLAVDLVELLEFPASKPSAFVTLDDRAMTFQGIWPEMGTLRGFIPWNQHLKVKKDGDRQGR